jgi:hypothetical protein
MPVQLLSRRTVKALPIGVVVAVTLAAGAVGASARPTDGQEDRLGDGYALRKTKVLHACFAAHARGRSRDICVHWATRTADAPPKADANDNGRPDQVDRTIRTLKAAWRREVVGLRYRPPLRDGGPRRHQGPNRGIDVYLADVGFKSEYGYCTTDHRSPSQRKQRIAPAYCVLDNDFSDGQFPAPDVNGADALHVTTAHEFFHAIQFAYDYSQHDQWLREGTAVWMEDQVYGGVHANYDYLDESPLSQPEVPLNSFGAPDTGESPEYGAWIFWRFLSEYLGTDAVRQVWARVGRRKPPIRAVGAVSTAREPRRCIVYCTPGGLTDVLAEFHLWNLLTSQPVYFDRWFAPTSWSDLFAQTYEEEAAYGDAIQPVPSDAEFFLEQDTPATGSRRLSLDHLSARSVDIALPQGGPVRVQLDLPRPEQGGAATIVWADTNSVHSEPVLLDADGRGTFEVPEPTQSGSEFIVVLLHNASPSHDTRPYRYSARLLP